MVIANYGLHERKGKVEREMMNTESPKGGKKVYKCYSPRDELTTLFQALCPPSWLQLLQHDCR